MIESAAPDCEWTGTAAGMRHEQALGAIALELFESLAPLHALSARDETLLDLAAQRLELLETVGGALSQREVICRATLATLPKQDERLVEAVADLSRHTLGHDAGTEWAGVSMADKRRILWITGLIRLAHAASFEFGWDVEGVYATWTELLLHIELDGAFVHETGLQNALGRCAALEVACGRRVILTSSHQRRRGVA